MKAIRTILACIRKADNTYNLINHGDKIVVGLSGGKDSVVLLYALSLYAKFSHTDFKIQPVLLNLGFPHFDASKMIEYCRSLGYDLIVYDSNEVYKILKIQQKDHNHLPCSICSRMKKAAINKVANEIGFNKVAFAHHADDAIETLLMNEIYGGRIATFAPKMHLEKANITFIRPLTLVRESDIIRLVKEEELPISSSFCPADKLTTREEIKDILKNIYHQYPQAKENFLTMLSNKDKLDIWDKEIFYNIDNDGLSLKPVASPLDMAYCLDIRNKVFILGQNVAYEEEVNLKEEEIAKYFLIYLKSRPIGTIRYIKEDDRTFKLGRFAVLKEYQHKGYGRKAFNFFINFIKEKYVPCTIYLNAQYQLEDFYASFGFIREGNYFIEANIKHIKMSKICR